MQNSIDDHLFEKRFVYMDKPSNKPSVESTASNEEVCIPKNTASLIDKLFRSSRICSNPEITKSEGINVNAKAVLKAHEKAKEEGREATTGELARAFWFPKKK